MDDKGKSFKWKKVKIKNRMQWVIKEDTSNEQRRETGTDSETKDTPIEQGD